MFKNSFFLSLVSAFRFFGIFVALPIIPLFYSNFQASTFLGALAASGYAITQIIFQTPFGILSDRYDKKNIIIIGLVIFILGSALCAMADNIFVLIIGRFLQGAGAIGSVISAQISDLVREEKRAGAMAVMGMGIFISFILAMIVGPLLGGHLGLNSVFVVSFTLGLVSLIVIVFFVPKSPKITYSFKNDESIKKVLHDRNIRILSLASLAQKTIMIMTFVLCGILIHKVFNMSDSSMWKIYTPAAVCGFFSIGISSVFAQKRGFYKEVILVGILCFALAYLCIGVSVLQASFALFLLGVALFFIGFSIQEPLIQTLASIYPMAHQKGASIGFVTTCGFVGSAFGGFFGAWFVEYRISVLVCIVVALCVVWFVLSLPMQNPQNENLYISLDDLRIDSSKLALIDGMQGVVEHYINQNENLLVIRVRKDAKEQVLQNIKLS